MLVAGGGDVLRYVCMKLLRAPRAKALLIALIPAADEFVPRYRAARQLCPRHVTPLRSAGGLHVLRAAMHRVRPANTSPRVRPCGQRSRPRISATAARRQQLEVRYMAKRQCRTQEIYRE